jgi:hypothetical protein
VNARAPRPDHLAIGRIFECRFGLEQASALGFISASPKIPDEAFIGIEVEVDPALTAPSAASLSGRGGRSHRRLEKPVLYGRRDERGWRGSGQRT